jgi:hypothetical protein
MGLDLHLHLFEETLRPQQDALIRRERHGVGCGTQCHSMLCEGMG